MEGAKGLRLNKQETFWVLYKNPEGLRYYQDGMLFYPGCKYAPVHIPMHLLPRHAQANLKKLGGYRKILTHEEINAESTLVQLKAERKALQKEREEFEKMHNIGVHTEAPPEDTEPIEPPVDDAEDVAQKLEAAAEADSNEQPEETLFPCPHCEKKYKDQTWLARHIENKHK